MVRARSLVWDHFEVDCHNESFAKCQLCLKAIARGGKARINFSTSPLRDHLQSCHKQEFEAMIKREKGGFLCATVFFYIQLKTKQMRAIVTSQVFINYVSCVAVFNC